jgi:Asp-tRNA(Asn)/Glu-tRNA(Gln) amidotransferase A subunit family amidase
VSDERLAFLRDIVALEVEHLQQTDQRLFQEPMDADRVRRLRHDIDLAERVDAFVARFGRLQDTVADKLLPALLQAKAESVGPALDNLNKAERFGWLASVDEWLVVRKLRNRMIHEYVKDPAELAQALQAAHDFVPLLVNTAQRMRQAA